jgi:hypothetical protein
MRSAFAPRRLQEGFGQGFKNQGLTQVLSAQVEPAGFFNKTWGFLYEKHARFFENIERTNQTDLVIFIKFQPPFSLVVLIFLSINPQNLTFQLAFMVIAKILIVQTLCLSTVTHIHVPTTLQWGY